MAEDRDIAEAHRKMARMLAAAAGLSGTVSSVDEDAETAEVRLTDMGADDTVTVLLNATKGGHKGVVIYPKVGSDVVVANVDKGGVYVIAQHGEIDKVRVQMGDAPEVVVEDGQIVLNGGSNGGLVNIEELQIQMRQTHDLLQALIDVINGPTVPEIVSGGPGIQSAMASAIFGMNLGDLSTPEMEDENVLH